MSIRLVRQIRRMRKVLAAAEKASGPETEIVKSLCRAMKLRRVPPLLLSSATDAPFATGVLKPGIVLPRELPLELPPEQLRIILAHELAHIRRRDLIAGLFEAILGVIWWFHPAMWWLKRELRRTR